MRANSAARDAAGEQAPAQAEGAIGKADEAKHEVEVALGISPADRDAHFMAATIAAMSGDPNAQEAHLGALQKAGADGYAVQMAFAEVAQARRDGPRERAALEAAHRFDATQVEPLRRLFELASTQRRDADALAALREIARLDQHNGRVYTLLLEKLVSSGQWDEAKRVGQAAIYVDVASAAIHVSYARALSATGEHEAAAFELESALLCDSKPKAKATAHALLARERGALRDPAGALAERDEALRLDPENEEARALKL